MGFSKLQHVILALLPKISAVLSLLGSLWIVIEVWTDKLKRSTVFHRLLLGMSCMDIVSSVSFFASTWPMIPYDEDHQTNNDVIWAIGNQTSCTIQGFFIQVGIASPVYNALLAFYYLMIIQFGYSETKIKNTFEVGMHGLAAAFAIVPATAGLFLNLYHNANVWCWIAPSPEEIAQRQEEDMAWEREHCDYDDYYNKDDDGCISTLHKPTHHGVFRWAFYYVIIWFCLVFAIGCLIAVYAVIRRRELARGVYPRRGSLDVLKPFSSARRNFHRHASFLKDDSFSIYSQNSFVMDNNSTTSSVGSLLANPNPAAAAPMPPVLSFSMSWGSQTDNTTIKKNNSMDNQVNTNSHRTTGSERLSRTRDSMLRSGSNRSINSVNLSSRSLLRRSSWNNTSFRGRDRVAGMQQSRRLRQQQEAKDAEAVIRAISQIKSSTVLSSVASSYASRQVYEQALLYTSAFTLTYTFATINRVVQEMTGEAHFPLMMLHVLFIPLQGLLNFLVYRRNAFRKLQLQYPHLGFWQTFLRTWRWSFLGPPKPLIPSMLDDENYKNPTAPNTPNATKESVEQLAPADVPALPEFPSKDHVQQDSGGAADGEAPSTPLETRYDQMDDFDVVTDLVSTDDVNLGAVDDLMASYADFPNLLTEEEDMVISTSFPVITVNDDHDATADSVPQQYAAWSCHRDTTSTGDSPSNGCYMCPQDHSD